MTDTTPQPLLLENYRAPSHLINDVTLTFHLDPDCTRVRSRIEFTPNPDSEQSDFSLDGEDLNLIWAKIDGSEVTPTVTGKGLTCLVPDGPFVWEAEVEINPAANTSLEGLYMSGGMYCTQCEAEGFRKITYYPDRPDVLAPFTVRVKGDCPVLLSNGNVVMQADGVAEWHDPWPKPSYLFALVAGDLVAHSDTFVTMSGRSVDLNIYVHAADIDKCDFAMQALKTSMTWDEETYGREYDLDVFNIVAVSDFNSGAMENKGLNIFNSAYVLASPETATDTTYTQIEAIIAHEYFHNWTGNRITCRDWFQLCLKEGLTVFRDQQFTGDMRGHAIKRIDDAIVMMAHQFREDGGPLSHPVRPSSVIEINNFYTATVYEKGAEVIGMLKRLVGDDAYYRACDLYFTRHDGQAATIEDWLAAFADTTGRDLTQFARWYSQAGTPQIHANCQQEDGTMTLTLRQELPPSADGSPKEPQVIPIAAGVIAPDGSEVIPTTTLELNNVTQTFEFTGIPDGSAASVLREFSAPVALHYDQSDAEKSHLLAYDTDPFNRWKAGRSLIEDAIFQLATQEKSPSSEMVDALGRVLMDDTADPAFRALVLTPPGLSETISDFAARGTVPDPDAIYLAHDALKTQLAQSLLDPLTRSYSAMQISGPYTPDASSAGQRALGNCALAYISRLDGGDLARRQFAAADNMTQQQAALTALLLNGTGAPELARFFDQWQDDKLVLDKWFGLQAACAAPDQAATVVRDLTQHPLFDWKNPNRFRALLGRFAGNVAAFHQADGSGYELLADWIIKLDPANPQTAARVTSAFDTWTMFDSDRQVLVKSQLDRIIGTSGLSPDVSEMASRIRG